MEYQVKRLAGPVPIDAKWDKPAWRPVQPIELANFMGPRPEHFPGVQAKVAYDAEAVYVIFRVEDRYVRAVAAGNDGPVWQDSCVEFFFNPAGDPAAGYFNLEMNCGGTMLLHHQVVPRRDSVSLAESDLARITVAHTLPRIVEPELTEPTTWTVEYRLPVDVLVKYCPGARRPGPGPGVSWRANFYKCADRTSHPHWLTWVPVRNAQPDFHRPQDFGTLQFE